MFKSEEIPDSLTCWLEELRFRTENYEPSRFFRPNSTEFSSLMLCSKQESKDIKDIVMHKDLNSNGKGVYVRLWECTSSTNSSGQSSNDCKINFAEERPVSTIFQECIEQEFNKRPVKVEKVEFYLTKDVLEWITNLWYSSEDEDEYEEEIILNCEEFEKKNSNVPTRPKPSKFPASSKTDDDIVQLRRTETSSIRKEHAQTIHETSKSSNVQEPLTAKGPYKLKIDNVTIKKNGKVEVRQRQVFFWDNEYLFRSDLIESDLEIDKYQISYRTKEGIRTVTFKNPIRNHDSISAESRSFLKKFLRRRSDKHLLEKKGILKNENVFGNKLPVLKELFGGNAVPPFVRKIMMLIEHEDNVKTEYIYRISGNMAVIQKIRLQIDENNIGILDKHVKDVEVLTGTLKLFYRELVDPVLPHKDFEQLNKILENVKDPKERSNQVMNVINQIESPNRENLKELIEHLLRIEAKCSSNKMTLKSLAIVWGPSLIWYPLDKYPDEGCKAVNFSLLVNDVVEMMFTSYKLFLSSKEEQRVNQNQNQQQLTTSTSDLKEFKESKIEEKQDLAKIPEENVIERQFSEEGTSKNTMASFVGGIFGLKKSESKEVLFGSSWSLTSFGSESKKANENPFYEYTFDSLPKRENESIPWMISDILKSLESKLTTKDLYMTSSSKDYMTKFRKRISKKQPDLSKMEPLDLALVLIRILRELSDNLIPEEIFLDYCDNYERLTSDKRRKFVENHLENLPDDRKRTLEKIMEHLFNLFQQQNNQIQITNVWLPVFCKTTKIYDRSLSFTGLIFGYYEKRSFLRENGLENVNYSKPFEYKVKIRSEEGELKTTFLETTIKDDVKSNFSNAQLNSIANSVGKNVKYLNKYSSKRDYVGSNKKS